MTDAQIPPELISLISVRDVGCTGVTLRAIRILEAIAEQRELVTQCLRFLRRELGGYASLWHLEQALEAADLRLELKRFAARLEQNADTSVETAYRLLATRPGQFRSAPSSSITRRLLTRLNDLSSANATAGTGLCGADAIGRTEILNIVGTRALAERWPTVVVTTPDRLVPSYAFDRLGSPLFERIPLSLFEAVVIADEVLSPDEAGRRAEAMVVPTGRG